MELKKILVIVLVVVFFALMMWLMGTKPEKEVFKKLRLFPYWFKFLGVFIIVPAMILPFVFDFLYNGKNYFGINTANLGLFFICFSRDKIEDEMTNLIRLKSFYRSVLVGFFYVFVMYLFDVLGGDEGNHVIGSQVVFMILFIYLMNYYTTKSKIRSEK